VSRPDSAATQPIIALSPYATPRPWDLVARGYTAELSEHLVQYAVLALRLAAVRDGERVLDVATGPGTLAIEAARCSSIAFAVRCETSWGTVRSGWRCPPGWRSA